MNRKHLERIVLEGVTIFHKEVDELLTELFKKNTSIYSIKFKDMNPPYSNGERMLFALKRRKTKLKTL
jgi:hypothetical protein